VTAPTIPGGTLTPAEMVEHLTHIRSVSVSVLLERVEDIADETWSESETMLTHYRHTAALEAHALGLEISEGPAHRWQIGNEVFFSWPVRPWRSRLPDWCALLPFHHGWSKHYTYPRLPRWSSHSLLDLGVDLYDRHYYS